LLLLKLQNFDVMALLVYLALGVAIIIAVLVIVIFAAVVLFQQLAVTPDPSEPHARDAAEDDGGSANTTRPDSQSAGAAEMSANHLSR
jgi:hypothetical protein